MSHWHLDDFCSSFFCCFSNRDDTVRCIVSSLTEDGSSELSDELVKGQSLVLDDSYQTDDANTTNWETWQPPPVDADCCKCFHA